MLSNSMDFAAINGEVMKVVVDDYRLDRQKCVGFMLDGCSANLKALDTLKMNFRIATGVRCFSHLCKNSGNEMNSDDTHKFAGHLHTLLSHSHNAKDLWLQETGGVAPPKPPSHRWSSRFERNDCLVRSWQQMKSFVNKFTSADESKSKSAAAMRDMLAHVRPDNIHQELVLQLEFVVAADVGIHLTRATHLLEGDGFLGLALSLNPLLPGQLEDKVNTPNVNALVREYANSLNVDENVKLWLKKMALFHMHGVRYHAYARIGDHPGAKEHATIRLFEGARLLNFTFVKGHQLEESDVHILPEVLPFVTPTVVAALVEEMDAYNVAAAETDAGCDLWAFWHDNRLKLSAWYNVAKDVALIQPSSAFMERVFSVLRACVDDRQEHCLLDRIEAAALLKYNMSQEY
ncbi:unnamed protein product [Ectocarpus sp. CCAP 1310/34]|nr:unnamed protein product [Ectocarpus sp. CCAP 1310/34]